MKKITIILLLIPVLMRAQQPLSLKNAIDTALKNNFDILIARDIADQNRMSNTFGMAGGMPSVNFTTNDNNTLNTIHQEYSAGPNLD